MPEEHIQTAAIDMNRQLDLIASVSKIEERTGSMQEDVRKLGHSIEILRIDIEKNFVTRDEFAPIKEKFVSKDQFEPVRNLVYGGAILLLTAVVTAIVGLIIP